MEPDELYTPNMRCCLNCEFLVIPEKIQKFIKQSIDSWMKEYSNDYPTKESVVFRVSCYTGLECRFNPPNVIYHEPCGDGDYSSVEIAFPEVTPKTWCFQFKNKYRPGQKSDYTDQITEDIGSFDYMLKNIKNRG
jgi:hypothetical protein